MLKPFPRLTILSLALMLCLVVISSSAMAQDPTDAVWSSDFDIPGVLGTVHALLKVGDTLYVGGDFDLAGLESYVNNIAIFDLKTMTWHRMGSGLWGTSSSVRALALDVTTGDIIAGGKFTGSEESNTLTHVARWNGESWSKLSGGVDGLNGEVLAIEMRGDAIFLGGRFTTAGGNTANNVVGWSPTSGWFDLGGGVSGTATRIEAMAFRGSHLYVGGWFSQAGYIAASNIAYFDLDADSWSSVSSGGVNGNVYALANGGGKMYVGGRFSQAGGITVNNIAELGFGLGAGWETLEDRYTGEIGLDSTVYHLNWSDHDLAIGGLFRNAGKDSVDYLTFWEHDFFGQRTRFGENEGPVYAIASSVDMKDSLYVGGDFETFNGLYCRGLVLKHYLWFVTGNGMHDESLSYAVADIEFNPDRNIGYVCGSFSFAGPAVVNGIGRYRHGDWEPLGSGIGDRSASAMAVVFSEIGYRYDTVYIAGNFNSTNGGVGTNIQMWAEEAWHPLGQGIGSGYQVLETDTSGNLYVGGFITSAGGQPVSGIAMWDGSTWSDVDGGVGFSGSPAVFDIKFEAETNRLYICGQFSNVGGVSAQSGVAYWDGGSWTPFTATKPGNYGASRAIGIGPNGDIYVGQYPSNGVALYKWSGSVWDTVGDGLVGEIREIDIVGCDVYAVGRLGSAGSGGSVALNDIVRWNGVEWFAFGSGLLGGLGAHALDVREGFYANTVYAGGQFYRAGGQTSSRFAIFSDSTKVAVDLGWQSPSQQDTLYYGDVAIFSWLAGTGISSISLEYSIDNGANWNVADASYPASYGAYIWEVPQSVNADSAFFLISGGTGCTAETFGPYVIRDVPGLTVQRIYNTYPGDEAVPYDPRVHGWSFRNKGSNMWPESHWDTLSLNYLPPVTHAMIDLHSKGKDKFQDWTLFAKTWGYDACYHASFSPKLDALAIWSKRHKKWGGSCYGFAVNSQSFFDHDHNWWDVSAKFPGYRFVNEIPIQDASRELINIFQKRQQNKVYRKHQRAFWDTPVAESLDSLRVFMGPNGQGVGGVHPLLIIKNWKEDTDEEAKEGGATFASTTEYSVSGGHAVVPYKITNDPDSADIIRIWVYDSNGPDKIDRHVRVNLADGTWEFSPLSWGFTKGMIPGPRFQSAHDAELAPGDFDIDERNRKLLSNGTLDDDTIFVSTVTSEWNDIVMTTAGGDSLGQVAGGGLIRNSTLGIPLVEEGPLYEYKRPTGYFFPDTAAEFALSGFDSSYTLLTWVADSVIYAFERDDCTSSQSDNLLRNSAWLYTNPDLVAKSISMRTVSVEPAFNWVMDIHNVPMAAGDSISVRANSDSLSIINSAESKEVSIYAAVTSDDLVAELEVDNLLIAGNAIVTIIPNWLTLVPNEVLILTDTDRDGLYEDTTILGVVTSTNNDEETGLPTDYKLNQNYPNPFNPMTTISYSLPVKSRVKIEIFNLLGQSVQMLVDREQSAGTYQVVWDGLDRYGHKVASGLYFYRLKTDGFNQSRKMILLK